MGKRLARGGLNYPGVGGTEHGAAPEGFARVLEEVHLGSGMEV